MPIARNAGKWRGLRQIPKCERCSASDLQVVGDSLRCQACGHQQQRNAPKVIPNALVEFPNNYQQPSVAAPVSSPTVLQGISLNPMAVGPEMRNYEQPGLHAITEVPEAKPAPPPVATVTENYQQPDFRKVEEVPTSHSKQQSPTLKEGGNYQQPGVEPPKANPEQVVKLPSVLAEPVKRYVQPGTENPAPKPGVGIEPLHLNFK